MVVVNVRARPGVKRYPQIFAPNGSTHFLSSNFLQNPLSSKVSTKLLGFVRVASLGKQFLKIVSEELVALPGYTKPTIN
jgi:hypothetical protein